MAITLKKTAAAGALCALLLATPIPASATATITVEFAYGGVAACGIGFFVYIAGSWEVPFATRSLQGALLEVGDGRARFGVPLPSLSVVSDPSGLQGPHDALQFDLLRWRF